MTEDGKGATVMIAAAEIGQGSETVLLQIAAEALGLELPDLTMAPVDTSISPIDLGSIANAIYDAVGVHLYDLPTTPARVLAAIKAKREAEGSGER